jgi:hypothetical protein
LSRKYFTEHFAATDANAAQALRPFDARGLGVALLSDAVHIDALGDTAVGLVATAVGERCALAQMDAGAYTPKQVITQLTKLPLQLFQITNKLATSPPQIPPGPQWSSLAHWRPTSQEQLHSLESVLHTPPKQSPLVVQLFCSTHIFSDAMAMVMLMVFSDAMAMVMVISANK